MPFTYKALNEKAPAYLMELLTPYSPTHFLQSEGQCILTVPCSNTLSYGDRTFAVMAPNEWNNLPLKLSESNFVETFKWYLKTHLFKQAF